MPELREETAPDHRAVGDRVQGLRLVQDGQPRRAQERGRDDRIEDGDQRRREVRDQAGAEEREGAREEAAQERGRILATPLSLGRRATAVTKGFVADDCGFLAGAIAYQIFFALIPLLALLVGILGFVYGSERAQRELVQLIREVYPSATAQETRIARQLVDGRALSLSLGVVGTLFSVLAIHGSLESALAAILGREGRRTFVRGRLEAGAFIAALVGLAVLSFGVSYGVQAVSGALVAAGFRDQVGVGFEILSPVVGLAVGYVFFFLVYRVLPRRRPPVRVASQAALVSAVLWEVAKLAFAYFTRTLGLFAVYGPLAFAAGLLTWIYLTAVIILIGAEVMKTRGAA